MGVEHLPKMWHSWNPTLPNDGLIYLANPQGLFWDGLGAGNSIRFPSNESINIYVFIYIYICTGIFISICLRMYICFYIYTQVYKNTNVRMSWCHGMKSHYFFGGCCRLHLDDFTAIMGPFWIVQRFYRLFDG